MNLVVLGGGAQGRVIAADLARAMPEAEVTVADVRPRASQGDAFAWTVADLSDPAACEALLEGRDLAVGALPSRFGFGAMRAAIARRCDLVDVSFTPEDPLVLDAEARRAGVTIVPDAGLAPGLTNLILGEAVARRGPPREAVLEVGGVAQDPTRPYGYVITWSPDDLLEEYTRPARIRRGGANVEVPAFDEPERVTIEGVGEMEAFTTDGLRSLLATLPEIADMRERTLRWPGHAEAVKPLIESGRLVEELRARCTMDPPRDLVVLRVRMSWNDGAESVEMVERYDPATGLTAMSRTTALTTSVVVQLAARKGAGGPGVLPLERVAEIPGAYEFVRKGLEDRGVRLMRREG